MKKSIKGLNCKFFKNIVLSSSLGICVACGNDLEKYNLNDVKYLKVNEVENLEKFGKEQIKDFKVEYLSLDFCKDFEEECFFLEDYMKIKTEKDLYIHPTNSLVFKIVTNKKEVILVGYNDKDKLNNIVFNIPKKVCIDGDEYLVTYIGKCSFCGCKFKQVNFPSSISFIDSNAFEDCLNLSKISLEEVGIIGSYAFKNCTSLSKLSLEGVDVIGFQAFNNCKSLTELSLKEVREICNEAFENCIGLEKISLDGVKIIGNYAFENCEANIVYNYKETN